MNDLLACLREPATIRVRCAAVTQAVADGRSGFFRLDRSALDAAAERVAALTLRRFPTLEIPYHSRWRHFEAGGVDRKAELDARLTHLSTADRARAQFDLTVVSVLLDAGAGPSWRYAESAGVGAMALPVHQHGGDALRAMLDAAASGKAAAPEPTEAISGPSFTRSEGLGVASFRGFLAGSFSARTSEPLRADAATLQHIDTAALRGLFQVSASNPMVGLEGRAGLLSRLGEALQADAARSGLEARPGLLYDRITEGGQRTEVSAAAVLGVVLRTLSLVWRSGSVVKGVPAGDVWPHRFAGAGTGAGGQEPVTAGWVPFHKLSQWLTYSLLEPLEWAGVRVTGLDALTGLPEYRNGGLLIDTGVIVPRTQRDLARTWKPSDEFVVEWRALTVTLLDELATRVRARLGKSAAELPLACILEGGTWAAGREIAEELRPGGAPPVKIESDGTVF